MNNYIKKQEEQLKKIINNSGYEVEQVELIPSSRPDLGQFQYNGIMPLAKIYHKNPTEIANKVIDEMKKYDNYINLNVAGPGFINISFSDNSLIEYTEKLKHDKKYLYKKRNKKILIDYGGPNIAKTLHVGHLRSANIGEALKRLAKALNYDVISDVHLGDWGRPMGLIILELKERYPDWVYFDESYKGPYPTHCPITNDDLEKLYPIASTKAKEDENYLNKAREITNKLQKKQKGYYELWKQIVSISVTEIKKIYNKLNVSFDYWNGESDADEYTEDIINYLKEKKLTRESQGALIVDVKNNDKSPMPPLILIKSSGAITYETTDIATIWERIKKFNPNEIWYVVDKRQQLHFEQVFRTVYNSNIASKNTNLEFIGFGTMNGKDGKPFKTRDGGVMNLESLINLVKEKCLENLNPNIEEEKKETISEQIAIAALKYADLLSDRNTDYIFDIEKFSDLNGKTGVYILYSTIRMNSLLKKAKESNQQIGPITTINNSIDRNIYLKLLEGSQILLKSFNEKSLHYITEYLYQLINIYNNFYSNNNVLNEKNKDLKQSWLGITEVVYNICTQLLDILGIEIPEKI